jgi:hypothetical protein
MYKFILTSLAALTMVLVASCGSVPLAGRSSKGEKFVGQRLQPQSQERSNSSRPADSAVTEYTIHGSILG